MPYKPMREELAWAAGFFDGEGSACVGRHRANHQLPYPQVKVTQSGEHGHELLERFNQATGQLGKIYGPTPPARNQNLVTFAFYANGLPKMKKIATILWPYLGPVKRTQFQQAIDTCFEQGSKRRGRPCLT